MKFPVMRFLTNSLLECRTARSLLHSLYSYRAELLSFYPIATSFFEKRPQRFFVELLTTHRNKKYCAAR